MILHQLHKGGLFLDPGATLEQRVEARVIVVEQHLDVLPPGLPSGQVHIALGDYRVAQLLQQGEQVVDRALEPLRGQQGHTRIPVQQREPGHTAPPA